MKLNKTLATMKKCNNEGGALTIYGDKAFQRVLNFKAVAACERDDDLVTLKLTDGSEIKAFYSEIA